MTGSIERVAEMAAEIDHVTVGTAVYAYVTCRRCWARGRYFNAGYLAGFIVNHENCGGGR